MVGKIFAQLFILVFAKLETDGLGLSWPLLKVGTKPDGLSISFHSTFLCPKYFLLYFISQIKMQYPCFSCFFFCLFIIIHDTFNLLDYPLQNFCYQYLPKNKFWDKPFILLSICIIQALFYQSMLFYYYLNILLVFFVFQYYSLSLLDQKSLNL